MSDAIESKGISLPEIFDPYMPGTTKARASGIDDAGTDTSDLYANIIYGTAAAATGIQSENADLNTLYAKKGTASYKLPVDGQTYDANGLSDGVAPIKPASGSILIQIGGGDYNIQTRVVNDGQAAIVKNNTFSIPSGMSYFFMTFTNNSTGIGGSRVNPPSGWTAIPGSLTSEAQITTMNQSNNGTQITQSTVNLYFGSTSGQTVWAGSFTAHTETDISA